MRIFIEQKGNDHLCMQFYTQGQMNETHYERI